MSVNIRNRCPNSPLEQDNLKFVGEKLAKWRQVLEGRRADRVQRFDSIWIIFLSWEQLLSVSNFEEGRFCDQVCECVVVKQQ